MSIDHGITYLPQRRRITKSKGRVNGRQELQEDIV
jgi:hypothetical protein